MATRAFHIFPAAVLACAALGPVHAAELGEARVQSHIGQALNADVELSLVEDPSKPVQARLAHRDVYRGANIAMPAVLSSLEIAVMRQGGKQFLHLSSSKPVESRYLHVYLELVDGGQRTVRLVTLWFAPDPHPAPPPAPAAAPLPVAAPVPTPVAEPAAQVAEEKSRKAVRPAAPVRKPAPPKRRPAPVETQADRAQAQEALADAAAPHAHDPKKDAGPAVKEAGAGQGAHDGKPVDARPAVAAAPAPAIAAAPAACAPQPTGAQLNACAVLGARNEALRQELGQLEEKVKVLQVATGVKSAAEAEAQTVAKPADARPKAAPRIHRKPKPAAPPEQPTPWLPIAGGVAALLALAGALVLLRRRRAASAQVLKTAREPEVVVLPQDGDPGAAAAKPRFMAAVKARLMARMAAFRRARQAPQAANVAPEPLEEKTIIQPE